MLADADVVEVDRRKGFRVLRRRAMLIGISVVLFAILGVVYGSHHHTYTSTSVVRVAKPLGLYLPGTTRTSTDDQRATVNETQILESDALARKVADKVGLGSVSVAIAPIDGGDVVDISATGKTPDQAREIANTMASTYVSERTDQINAQVNSTLSKIGKEINTNRKLVDSLDKPGASSADATLRGIAVTSIKQEQGQQANYQEAQQEGSAYPAVTVKATKPHRDRYRALLEYGLIGAALGVLLGIFAAVSLERTRSRIGDATDVAELGALSPPRVISIKPGRTPRRAGAEASAVRTLVRSILDQDRHRGWVCVSTSLDGRSNDDLLGKVKDQLETWGRRVAVVGARFDGPTVAGGPALTPILDGGAGRSGAGEQSLDRLREFYDGVIVDVGSLEALLLLANSTTTDLSCFVALAPNAVLRDDLARQLEELSAWDVPVLAAVVRPTSRVAPNHARPRTPSAESPPEQHDSAAAMTGPASRD